MGNKLYLPALMACSYNHPARAVPPRPSQPFTRPRHCFHAGIGARPGGRSRAGWPLCPFRGGCGPWGGPSPAAAVPYSAGRGCGWPAAQPAGETRRVHMTVWCMGGVRWCVHCINPCVRRRRSSCHTLKLHVWNCLPQALKQHVERTAGNLQQAVADVALQAQTTAVVGMSNSGAGMAPPAQNAYGGEEGCCNWDGALRSLRLGMHTLSRLMLGRIGGRSDSTSPETQAKHCCAHARRLPNPLSHEGVSRLPMHSQGSTKQPLRSLPTACCCILVLSPRTPDTNMHTSNPSRRPFPFAKPKLFMFPSPLLLQAPWEGMAVQVQAQAQAGPCWRTRSATFSHVPPSARCLHLTPTTRTAPESPQRWRPLATLSGVGAEAGAGAAGVRLPLPSLKARAKEGWARRWPSSTALRTRPCRSRPSSATRP